MCQPVHLGAMVSKMDNILCLKGSCIPGEWHPSKSHYNKNKTPATISIKEMCKELGRGKRDSILLEWAWCFPWGIHD